MDLASLLALLGGVSAVSIAVSVWLSSLFINRLLSRWRRQENELLENLRTENARASELVQAGIRSFSVDGETLPPEASGRPRLNKAYRVDRTESIPEEALFAARAPSDAAPS
jgi:hypothetical protein